MSVSPSKQPNKSFQWIVKLLRSLAPTEFARYVS